MSEPIHEPIQYECQRAGEQIRKILQSLRAEGHSLQQEVWGLHNHGTDALRKLALDVAGICWKAPGEMAPGCGCPWIGKEDADHR